MAKELTPIRTIDIGGKLFDVFYDGPEVTKQEAREKGLDRYFNPGMPCIHGHLAQRHTSNGGCVICDYIRRGKPVETQAAETPPAPKPSVEVQAHPMDYVRAVIASKGYSKWQVKGIYNRASEYVEGANEQSIRAFVAAGLKTGRIEDAEPSIGRNKKYRVTPKFFAFESGNTNYYAELIPPLHDQIIEAFENAAHDEHRSIREVKEKQAEEDAMSALADIQTVETPEALIGRAIWQYIGRLRKKSDYEGLKAKVADIHQMYLKYKDRSDFLERELHKTSDEKNQLQRAVHELNMENNKLKTENNTLKDLLEKRNRGTFSLGEVAKIKEVLGSEFAERLRH